MDQMIQAKKIYENHGRYNVIITFWLGKFFKMLEKPVVRNLQTQLKVPDWFPVCR